MASTRYSHEKILEVLGELEAGASVAEVAQRHEISESTIRRWQTKFRGALQKQEERQQQVEALTQQLGPDVPDEDDRPWLSIRGGIVGWIALLLLCTFLVVPLFVPLWNADEGQRQFERIQQFASAQNVSSLEQLDFSGLPERRLDGAWLPRDSTAPWAIAGGLAAIFLALLVGLFPRARTATCVLAGLFTAVAGMALLTGFQYLASLQIPAEKANGYLMPLIWLVNLIGRSYGQLGMVLGGVPMGFFELFFTLVLTAGLCEETCKAIPYLTGAGGEQKLAARRFGYTSNRLFTWGFASGIGFGLAEAIHYSTTQYNGLMLPDIYVVRFLSVVGLHGVWAGAAALNYYRLQEEFQSGAGFGPYGWLLRVLRVIAVPVLLHALYDAFAFSDMQLAGIGAAFASVVYLGTRVVAAEHHRTTHVA
ncbi:MAG: transposase [Planctomycetes bacterium]|nr:transposase [Planctomycetota bacterium]